MDDLKYDEHISRAEYFLRSAYRSAVTGNLREAIDLASHARTEIGLLISELYLMEQRRMG